MPNWIEGVLKIRGAKEDVQNFLLNGLCKMRHNKENMQEPIQEKLKPDDSDFLFYNEKTCGGWVYIENTKRGFITYIEELFTEMDDIHVALANAKFAWDIDVKGLTELSKEYNIDFRMYGFEMGMCFNREIEIHKGKVIRNTYIEFVADSYNWDCIDPLQGG